MTLYFLFLTLYFLSLILYFLCQIIGAVYGVKESYHNLHVLITFLRLQEQKQSKLLMDLSCANKVSGLQSQVTSCPCELLTVCS